MVSERKKLFAMLDERQRLEDEYNITRSEEIKDLIESMTPSLLNYFRCSPQDFSTKFPKTSDMKVVAEKQRYFAPRKTPQQRTGEIYDDLRRVGTDLDYLRFLRVSKSVFNSIMSSVFSQHQVFKNHSNNGQENVEKQLAITLWRLGHHGKDAGIGEASKIFGLSEGTIMKCTQRCMEALKDTSIDIISWPVRGEKQTIKFKIKDLASRGSTSTTMSKNRSTTCSNTSPADITTAVGILSSMYVYLVSKPLLKSTDEYLVPIHPSALEAANSLSIPEPTPRKRSSPPKHSGPEQPHVIRMANSSKPAGRKKITSSKENNKKTGLISGCDGAVGMASEGFVETQARNGKRLRSKSNTLIDSHSLVNEEHSSTLSPPPEKKTRRSHPHAIVRSAYLKRNFGYNILLVCDYTTRIRFADVARPACWSNQQVFDSSQLSTESATLFEGSECLITDSSFSPNVNTLPMLPESEIDLHSPESSIENKMKYNEALDAVYKRARDCQRALKARFPSLLGMRVQLKDGIASQENVRNWVLACMTIHNLVLGDDSCYNREWEDQLDEMESQMLKQQEQQAKLMWKLEHLPTRRARKEHESSAKQDIGVDVLNHHESQQSAAANDYREEERDELESDEIDELEEDDEYDERNNNRVSEDIYELEDSPVPETVANNTNSCTSSVESRLMSNSSVLSPISFDESISMSESLSTGRPQKGHSLSMLLN
ncbi:hypothetical protein BGZ76_006878 [Entomortierella beljakovae]|nr:hypothetical protein BGZ76_006878 [Entomortierella beljakovae]